jgi:hypothetical protein
VTVREQRGQGELERFALADYCSLDLVEDLA